mgnify:CR=1 FL=1
MPDLSDKAGTKTRSLGMSGVRMKNVSVKIGKDEVEILERYQALMLEQGEDINMSEAIRRAIGKLAEEFPETVVPA